MSAGVLQPALPPRSMVGQLPLEQPIGVRIPGGQPNKHFPALSRTSSFNQNPHKPENLAILRSLAFAEVRREPSKIRGADWVQFPTKWGTTLISILERDGWR